MVKKDELCISIIGGSSALGETCSSVFIEHGFRTFCSYNNNLSRADKSNWFKCDVSSKSSVDSFVMQTTRKSNKHVVIYLAGISVNSMTHRIAEFDWERVIDVNMTGAFRVAHSFLPYMREHEWGRFIFAGSITPRVGVAGTCAYSASKAGLCGLSRTIAVENATKGITSNCLEIGYMDAGMTYTIPEEFRKKMKETIPIGQFCDPKSIAKSVMYLIDNSDVTGTILSISGGL